MGAGAVEHDRLVALAEARLTALNGPEGEAPSPARYLGGETIAKKPLEQTHLVVGFEGRGVRDFDHDAAHVFAAVTGGAGYVDQKRALASNPALVVATPGRLRDALERGKIDASALAAVVLDEADSMLDLGFREDLEAILAKLPAERRSHLVSATFPREVMALADRFQRCRRSAQASERFRFGDSPRTALASDLHEKAPERIVEFLDVRQHPHAAGSCGGDLRRVHAAPARARGCMTPFLDLLDEAARSAKSAICCAM